MGGSCKHSASNKQKRCAVWGFYADLQCRVDFRACVSWCCGSTKEGRIMVGSHQISSWKAQEKCPACGRRLCVCADTWTEGTRWLSPNNWSASTCCHHGDSSLRGHYIILPKRFKIITKADSRSFLVSFMTLKAEADISRAPWPPLIIT